MKNEESDQYQRHPIAVCTAHEPLMEKVFGEADSDIDDATWDQLQEVAACPDCKLLLHILVGDSSDVTENHQGTKYPDSDSEPAKPILTERFSNTLRLIKTPFPRSSSRSSFTNVSNVRICKGDALERRILFGSRLRDAGLAQEPLMELVGMFNATHPDSPSTEEKPSCVDVVWKFGTIGHEYNNGLPVDELAIFMLNGQIEWTFPGGEPQVIGHNPGEPQLLWVSADPRGWEGHAGIPPFNIRVIGSQPAWAMAKLYSWEGVACTEPDPNGILQIVEGTPWSDTEIESYWHSIKTHVPQMKRKAPFTTCIPLAQHELEDFMQTNRHSERDDVHDRARKAEQVFDADVPGWPVKYNMPGSFKRHDLLTGTASREHPIIDFRLVEFPKGAHDIPASQIEVAHHPGFETFVSLHGAFRCGWAKLPPKHAERVPASLGTFSKRPKKTVVHSASDRGVTVPDILLLRSETVHGFTAHHSETAYALLIRCYDYHISRPHGRDEATHANRQRPLRRYA